MADHDGGDGVALGHYRTHDGCGVLLTCLACQAHHQVDLEKVIARLVAVGLGDASTGIRAVGRLADRPCLKCGATRWESRPAFRLPKPER